LAVDGLHAGLCAADISGHVAPRPERIADRGDTRFGSERCRRRDEMRLRQPSQARLIFFFTFSTALIEAILSNDGIVRNLLLGV